MEAPRGLPTKSTLATRTSSTSGWMSRRRMISAPPYPLPPMTAALKRFIVFIVIVAPRGSKEFRNRRLTGWDLLPRLLERDSPPTFGFFVECGCGRAGHVRLVVGASLGVARVARFRPPNDSYIPGRKLSDYSAIFVEKRTQTSEAIGVTSHFEKLAASKCAISSGDKFTCTTCHDPHSEPSNAAAHFNPKCQSCHQQKPCQQTADLDCIKCHMPKAAGRGVDHSSYTDHSIRVSTTSEVPAPEGLVGLFPNGANSRDRGLALATLSRFESAQALLEAAVQTNPIDIAALVQLAQIYDRQGRESAAQPLYEAILKLDPNHPTAATNLAVIRVKGGRSNEAIQLWRTALKSNPAQTGVRMNVAQALFRQGKRKEAATEIETALRYDPDQPAARRLLQQLR